MITWPVSESSWPVGSSARRSFGPVRQRPGDRDPLLLAARQLVRPVLRPVGQADDVEQRRAPGRPARARSRGRGGAAPRRSRPRSGSARARTPGRRTRRSAAGRRRAGPRPSREISWPSTTTRPDVGLSSPPSRLRSVVLPLPDRPRTAMSSPGATARLIAAQRVDDAVARPGSRGRGRSPRRAAGRCRAARRRPTRTAASSSVVAPAGRSPEPAVPEPAFAPSLSGQTPTWSSSRRSRTRCWSPSAAMCCFGSCSRPARSRTANSSLIARWSPSSPSSVRRSVSVEVRPSRIATVRWTCSDTTGSWVTVTIVVPSCSLIRRRSANTSSDVAAVELAGRLVGEDDLGLVGEGHGDRDALLLAARQPLRPVLQRGPAGRRGRAAPSPGPASCAGRRGSSASRRSRPPTGTAGGCGRSAARRTRRPGAGSASARAGRSRSARSPRRPPARPTGRRARRGCSAASTCRCPTRRRSRSSRRR